VILVNLLPHREAARKRRDQQFKAAMALAAILGVAVCLVVWLTYQARIALQNDKNNYLQTEITKLDAKIKDIAALRDEIAALQVRQRAVEDLQADRNLPVHLLEELVKQMPDGTYVTNIKQDGTAITIDGVAQSQERISQLLSNMGSKSEWFNKPDLIQIQAQTQKVSASDARRVYAFSMRLTLVKPSDVEKNAADADTKALGKTAGASAATPAAVASAAAPGVSASASAAKK